MNKDKLSREIAKYMIFHHKSPNTIMMDSMSFYMTFKTDKPFCDGYVRYIPFKTSARKPQVYLGTSNRAAVNLPLFPTKVRPVSLKFTDIKENHDR